MQGKWDLFRLSSGMRGACGCYRAASGCYRLRKIAAGKQSSTALTSMCGQSSEWFCIFASGGIIFTASPVGVCSTPYIATYSAAKVYALMSRENLWGELKDSNVHTVIIIAGNTVGQKIKDILPVRPALCSVVRWWKMRFPPNKRGEYPWIYL